MNVDLIRPSVHLSAFGLVLSAMLVVLASICMKFQHNEEKKKSSIRELIKFIIKNLGKELVLIYYGSSIKFKWLSLLFTILTFYMTTSFMCLYKTSQIIVHEPFVVKNYQMLINDKASLPIFHDISNSTIDYFRFAPDGSTRKKVWTKLINSGDGWRTNILSKNVNLFNYGALKYLFNFIHKENYILFSLFPLIDYIRTILCSMSPKPELWRVFKFHDDSEKENLFSFAISSHYNHMRSIRRSLSLFFESHIWHENKQKNLKYFEHFVRFDNHIDRKHRCEQDRICSKDYKFTSDLTVHPIGLNYFKSFFLACLIIYLIAFIVQKIELLLYDYKKRTNIQIRRTAISPRPRLRSLSLGL